MALRSERLAAVDMRSLVGLRASSSAYIGLPADNSQIHDSFGRETFVATGVMSSRMAASSRPPRAISSVCSGGSSARWTVGGGAGSLGGDHGHWFVHHAAQGVAKRTRRQRVEPLHVVDRQRHRTVGRQRAQQPQHLATTVERVGVRVEQGGIGGHLGEQVAEPDERALQLVLPWPGDEDAMRPGAQLVDDRPPHRGLADARLTTDDGTTQLRRRLADVLQDARQLSMTTGQHRPSTVQAGARAPLQPSEPETEVGQTSDGLRCVAASFDLVRHPAASSVEPETEVRQTSNGLPALLRRSTLDGHDLATRAQTGREDERVAATTGGVVAPGAPLRCVLQ